MRHERFAHAALLAALAFALLAPAAKATPAVRADGPVVGTIAGGIPSGRPATSVSLQAADMVADARGNVYFTDPNAGLVWKLAPDGVVTHVAGTGRVCYEDDCTGLGDGGPAAQAYLETPYGIALAPDGDLLVGERRGHAIRRIDADTGVITTWAGLGARVDGEPDDYDAAPALESELSFPGQLETDSKGNVYVADWGHNRIRKITPDGMISTVVGCGRQNFPECFYHPQDGSPLEGTHLAHATGFAISPHDELYLSNLGGLFKVDLQNEVYVQIGGGYASQYAEFPGQGEGGPVSEARFGLPDAMTFGPDGALYLIDSYMNRVQKIDAPVGKDSVIHHVASCSCGTGERGNGYSGDGGAAKRAAFAFFRPASFTGPGITVEPDGDVVIGDIRNNRVRRVDAADGTVATIAGNGHGAAMGHLPGVHSFLNFYGGRLRGGLSGDGDQARWAQFASPTDVAVDPAGNVFVLDRHNQRIRRISIDGTIATVVGSGVIGEQFYTSSGEPAGDGAPATSAKLRGASAIALSADGKQLYIADKWSWALRQVNLSNAPVTVFPLGAKVTIQPGHIQTVFASPLQACPACKAVSARAHQISHMTGVAVDSAGNLYVADSYVNVVQRVNGLTGARAIIAGTPERSNCARAPQDGTPGPATMLCGPTGLTLSPDGKSLFIVETGEPAAGETLEHGWVDREYPNKRTLVRKLDVTTLLTTIVAGSGTRGDSGDGGPAKRATLAHPHDVAVGKDGSLFIADTGSGRIRRVGTDGTITTVAGSGGYADDGSHSGRPVGCTHRDGPARDAAFCIPMGLAFGPDGTLYVADSQTHSIRTVTGL